jgi:hypothetical protein
MPREGVSQERQAALLFVKASKQAFMFCAGIQFARRG